jgi:hypothetical protein
MSWPTEEMVEAARVVMRTDTSPPEWSLGDIVENEGRHKARTILTAALAAAPREWGVRGEGGHGAAFPNRVTAEAVQEGDPNFLTLVSRTAPGPWEPAGEDEKA